MPWGFNPYIVPNEGVQMGLDGGASIQPQRSVAIRVIVGNS